MVAPAAAIAATGTAPTPAPNSTLRVARMSSQVVVGVVAPSSPITETAANPASPAVASPSPRSRVARTPQESIRRPHTGPATVNMTAATAMTTPSWLSDSASSRDSGASSGKSSCWAVNSTRTATSSGAIVARVVIRPPRRG